MKKILVSLMVLLISTHSFAASGETGKKLTEKFLSDKSAALLLYGGATPDPRLELIFTKIQAWEKLNQDEKESVCLFVKSLVQTAKKNPSPYINIPSSAPVYMRIVSNAKNMCDDCWGISSEQGGIVMGDEAWNRAEFKGNIKKFSAFSIDSPAMEGRGKDTRGKNTVSSSDVLQSRLKAFANKLSSEEYYSVVSEVEATTAKITFFVTPLWERMTSSEKEEMIQRAFSLWLNIGSSMTGKKESPGDYHIDVCLKANNRKVATWNSLKGFNAHN